MVDPAGTRAASIEMMPVRLTDENVRHLSIWRQGRNIGWDAWGLFSTDVMTRGEASRFGAKCSWFMVFDNLADVESKLEKESGNDEASVEYRAGLMSYRMRVLQAVDSWADSREREADQGGVPTRP